MLNTSTNTTLEDINEISELSDWGKLFIVLGVSIIFWII